MTTPPKTIPEYLDQLRAALAGADPALLQDALYDAEEYLRAELAEHPEIDEASILATVATSYGAPEEVADIYRVQETTVNKVMRTPLPAPRRSALGRFFGVAADPHTYGALVYMLLALPVGIFYFTWAVTGLSLSAGFAILIFGIPFAVLFMGTVYALSSTAQNTGATLSPIIAAGWSLPTALSLLAWYVFAPQCLSTLAVVKRETNSWRYPLIMAGYLFALAYAASFVTYNVAVWFMGKA